MAVVAVAAAVGAVGLTWSGAGACHRSLARKGNRPGQSVGREGRLEAW